MRLARSYSRRTHLLGRITLTLATLLFVTLLVLAISSFFRSLEYDLQRLGKTRDGLDSGYAIFCERGALMLVWTATSRTADRLRMRPLQGQSLITKHSLIPSIVRLPGRGGAVHCHPILPLWLPITVFGLVAFALRRFAIIRDWPDCFCCGYRLHGNQSGICPECGTPIPPEQVEQIKWAAVSMAPSDAAEPRVPDKNIRNMNIRDRH